jgi:8-oxo-dGTP pyrophosphatase MutT (NUDIX family)
MYDKMLVENSRRYAPIPNFIVDAVRDYLLPNSRLLSSIFFGVLPVWAHALANKIPSDQMMGAMAAMRKVRQLNDEILDVNDDICYGLLTLPWLYAIEEKPILRRKIEKLWKEKDITNSKTFIECQQILYKSSSRKRTAVESLKFLSQSMRITIESFPINRAFEITLLHNIRWALLNWLEQVNYNRDVGTIREPCLPQDTILDTANPIEPIPGGGVIVVNDTNQVLMTLVLKRGMLRWELPTGVAKDGESMEETAKREALEETGKQITIGDAVAMCWHHSRKLNKGWLGVIFRGELINADSNFDFKVITPQAFAHGKFNIRVTPELYSSIKPMECDFEELLRLCNSMFSTAHESVVASGFVDWKKIPIGRMHPLHRKLLEAYEAENHCMELLVSDADKDFESYDVKSKLYYNS